ncbi:hypothetical protein DPMN_117290 [Dreissena polymorpha]|uniref:Uncharacterized protein n=1 Tax=Dreissena polymorpha TaxID=45954 RepID=A0A9D4KQD0_DREPO|nr:hypothetical protein DPMN_117290 [Dreissena polymorpha]
MQSREKTQLQRAVSAVKQHKMKIRLLHGNLMLHVVHCQTMDMGVLASHAQVQ